MRVFMASALSLSAAVLLLAGFARPAAAQSGNVFFSYNGDADASNAANTISAPITGGTASVAMPNYTYIGEGGVPAGASFIGTVQEDPLITLNLTFTNRTDLAPTFGLGSPRSFSEIFFSIEQFGGPSTGLSFLGGGVIAGTGPFDSFTRLSPTLVRFFSSSGSLLRPGQNFGALLLINAPDPGPDAEYSFGVNITSAIPEPGTLALVGTVGLPALLGAVRLRRSRHRK